MTDRPMGIGRTFVSLLPPVGLSIAWFTFVWVYFSGQSDAIWQLKPNDFGDFFAGVFAPVAFVWFGYAVFLQSRELRLQRSELALTRSELELTRRTHEHAVAEQKRMVEQQAEQTRIMTDELKSLEASNQEILQKKEYDFLLSKFAVPISKKGPFPFSFRKGGGAINYSEINFKNSIAEQIATGNEYHGYIEAENFLEQILDRIDSADTVEDGARFVLDIIAECVASLSEDLILFNKRFTPDPPTSNRMRLHEISSLAALIQARADALLGA